jgi:hypothetical protein
VALPLVRSPALVDLRRRVLARLADPRGAGTRHGRSADRRCPAPPADRPGGTPVRPGLAARPPGPRLLRLYALPRRLPDEPGRRPRCPRADRRRGRRRLRHDRPGPRRRGRHEAVRGLLPGRIHRAHRHRRPDPGHCRGLGRLVRAGGIGLRVRLRHGPYGRHLPRGRGGAPPAPDLVRSGAGSDRGPRQRAGDGGCRDACRRCADRAPGHRSPLSRPPRRRLLRRPQPRRRRRRRRSACGSSPPSSAPARTGSWSR